MTTIGNTIMITGAGELTVDFETLSLPGDPDQTLFVYTTKPAPAPAKPWTCSPAGSSPAAHTRRGSQWTPSRVVLAE